MDILSTAIELAGVAAQAAPWIRDMLAARAGGDAPDALALERLRVLLPAESASGRIARLLERERLALHVDDPADADARRALAAALDLSPSLAKWLDGHDDPAVGGAVAMKLGV